MLFLFLTGIIFIVEYYIKKHMDRVRTLDEQRPLVHGTIILKKYYNTGAAGNFLSAHPDWMKRMHAVMFGAVSCIFILTLQKKRQFLAKTGLSFLTGAGMSNLHDRLVKGHVVDYVSFGCGPQWFRRLVFNMADFFVFAGIILCVAQIMIEED